MSQCSYVVNWNFKTEIGSPSATFSSPAATFSSPAAERYRKCLLILCCTWAPNTRASCLCLSGNKMAAMASTKPIRLAPTSLKATVWQHFEFHKVEGDLTRPTQFVRCVELNLNTSATQLIWETTLRDTTQSWERSSDLLQMPARERWSRRWHSFSWTLRERSGLPNLLQVLLHWI